MITIDQLTEGQKEAFEKAKELILKADSQNGNFKASTNHLTINGPAGTGKTTMMKFLISWARSQGITGMVLAAPTHQSKKVLANATGEEVSTIHSILRINPTTYEEKQFFEQKKAPDLQSCKVLICDEASFYNMKLFDILMNSIMPWTIVISIGDKEQLRPSDDDGAISRFFTDRRFEQVYLTEVKRSNGPIIKVATEVRNGGWIRECIEDNQGVFQNNSVKGFLDNYFKIVKDADDLFETRGFAYTNKSVNKFNEIVRKILYKTEYPFIKDEVLVMQAPLINSVKYEGKSYQEIIFNNGELCRVIDVQETNKVLRCRGTDFKLDVNYFRLKLESIDNPGQTEYINTIYSEQEQASFHYYMGKVVQQYKSGSSKAYWDDFWEIKNSFHDVKAIPFSTIHKGQGSTVDNSFLYTPCTVKNAEPDLAKQLIYVGLTRPRYNVHYV